LSDLKLIFWSVLNFGKVVSKKKLVLAFFYLNKSYTFAIPSDINGNVTRRNKFFKIL
jgi:hypothetical protein